ncbi:hypothetical protein Tco_1485954, partial [Tanacetum coccineum]
CFKFCGGKKNAKESLVSRDRSSLGGGGVAVGGNVVHHAENASSHEAVGAAVVLAGATQASDMGGSGFGSSHGGTGYAGGDGGGVG